MMRSGLFLCAAAMALFLVSGCDKHAQDKKLISDAWDSYHNGNVDHKGDQVAKVLSQKSMDRYTRLLKIALEAPKTKTLDLPPSDMEEVLKMRHRLKRSEYRNIDGKAYLILATNKGFYEDDDPTWKLTEIKIAADRGTATVYNPEWEKAANSSGFARSLTGSRYRAAGIGLDQKPPRYSVDLVKEGGDWKIDEPSMIEWWDKRRRAEAKEARMSMRDFLMAEEMERTGEDVPMSIWDAKP